MGRVYPEIRYNSLTMRVLAIDPGEKYLGVAVSDPTGTIANPLTLLRHRSKAADAEAIVRLAEELGVGCIVVGQATDAEGRPTTLQARRAANLAAEIRARTAIPVVLWDETGTTQAVREAWAAMKVSRRHKRRPDALAATVLLQSYLEAQREGP